MELSKEKKNREHTLAKDKRKLYVHVLFLVLEKGSSIKASNIIYNMTLPSSCSLPGNPNSMTLSTFQGFVCFHVCDREHRPRVNV